MKRLCLVSLSAIVLGVAACTHTPQIEKIQFVADNSAEPDSIKLIRHFKKQGGLYVLSYFGGYEKQMDWLNDYLIKISANSPTAERYCSIFTAVGDSGQLYHCQSFDNRESGILVGLYDAPGKYRSIAISRMTDIKFFAQPFHDASLTYQQKTTLPFFAYYPANGINEEGLSVSIAGSYPHEITQTEGRKGVFITYLNRLILDSCKTVEEAIVLAGRYYFFDHGHPLRAENHLVIADRFGTSVVMEYNHLGEMKFLVTKKADLVVTNEDVVGADAQTLKEKCRRYKKLHAQLTGSNPRDFMDCVDLLKSVRNHTLWAVVMDNRERAMYISAREDFADLYSFSFRD